MRIVKQFLLAILLVTSMLSVGQIALAATDCTGWSENVSDCLAQKSSDLKSAGAITLGDYSISGGVKQKVIDVTNKIITITTLLSVGAIVFSGFLMVTAYGDDEWIKKGKNSLKWGIGGLLAGLLSFAFVNAIVNFFSGIGG